MGSLFFPRSYSVCHTVICIGGNFKWLVCKWIPIFRAQVYEWGGFWNVGAAHPYQMTPWLPGRPPSPPPPPHTHTKGKTCSPTNSVFYVLLNLLIIYIGQIKLGTYLAISGKLLMSHLMRLWYFSSSVNSFCKRSCAATQWGLDVWFLVGPFVYFHTSCVRTTMALARLRGCAGSSKPSLVAYVISTIISWAGSILFSLPVYNAWTLNNPCWVKPGKTLNHIPIGIR